MTVKYQGKYYMLWLADAYINATIRQREIILKSIGEINHLSFKLGIPSNVTEVMLLNACIEVEERKHRQTIQILDTVFPAKPLPVKAHKKK